MQGFKFSIFIPVLAMLLAGGLLFHSCSPVLPPYDDTGDKVAEKLVGLWFLTNIVRTVTNTTTTNDFTESGANTYYLEFYSDRSCLQTIITNNVTNTNRFNYSVDNTSNLSLMLSIPATNFAINFGFYIVYDIQQYYAVQKRKIGSIDDASFRMIGIAQGNANMNISVSIYSDSNMTTLLGSETINSNISSNLNELATDFELYLKK